MFSCSVPLSRCWNERLLGVGGGGNIATTQYTRLGCFGFVLLLHSLPVVSLSPLAGTESEGVPLCLCDPFLCAYDRETSSNIHPLTELLSADFHTRPLGWLCVSPGTSASHAGSGPEGPGDQPGVLAEPPLPPALRQELRPPGLSTTKVSVSLQIHFKDSICPLINRLITNKSINQSFVLVFYTPPSTVKKKLNEISIRAYSLSNIEKESSFSFTR